MLYANLYSEVQSQDRISTNWLAERAIAHSPITRIKEQWSGMLDQSALRGVYIEGPLGPPVPLQPNEALIILSREMCRGHLGAHWRRMIKTKEMMHVFDLPEEKAGSPETFDTQVEKFRDPNAPTSPQFRAEAKAFWRALAVLCPEQKRIELKQDLKSGSKTIHVVGAALRIPPVFIQNLMRDDFLEVIRHLM